MKLLEIIKSSIKFMERKFREIDIAGVLSKQPVFFYVFIVAFLIMRYSFIYNNAVFAYKGMILLLYSVLAFLITNFARDIGGLLREKTSSKMSFIVTIFYHLAQISALYLAFLYLK